jgi:hypothetical protein
MGSVKNVNKVFNNNDLNIDVDQNSNIKDFNVSSFSNSVRKEDDFDRSLNKIINDNKEINESKSKKDDFESNFDE